MSPQWDSLELDMMDGLTSLFNVFVRGDRIDLMRNTVIRDFLPLLMMRVEEATSPHL